uniref:RING-type domain-containing protein n=1 Tax=Anopheles farauti TaxID=69004 RepID=A0A182QCF0_9DIPT
MSTVKSAPSLWTLGENAEDHIAPGTRIGKKAPPLPSIPEVQPSVAVVREQQQQQQQHQLRQCFVPADENGCLGLHLSRTPWDPYPWVSGVVEGSCADAAGVRIGDCVLEANGEDLLGLKVIDIAKRVRSRRISRTAPAGVGLLLWNSGFEKNNLNPQSLSRFANCLQGIAGLLECPICLDIIRPPSWQCNHGHLICSGCRSRTTKCPICRDVLGRGRCIVADKLFHYLVQTLGHEANQQQQQQTPSDRPKSHDLQTHLPPGGRLPLMLREYHPRSGQHATMPSTPHETHKAAFKLKANIAHNDTARGTQATPSPVTFHCPSGQPCARMKNQHDILIHLQKAHQTSVVQYYVTEGDTVEVALSDGGNSLACVVLLPTSSTSAPKNNQLFFVAKFRSLKESNEAFYWLWHLGDEPGSRRFQVHLLPIAADDRPLSWQGRSFPLEMSCQEVVRSNLFVRMKQDVRRLRVRIVNESNEPVVA